MFEPLFARLSDSYHLVAPDYPGFGHSDWPDPKKFAYTFDHYLQTGEGDWSARFELEERQRLIQAMTKAAGNKSKAARALGMPRSTFVSKMEKHGLLPRRS